jgi:hypothetical protein
MNRGGSGVERAVAARAFACSAIPLVIPLAVYARVYVNLGAMHLPQMAALRGWTIRLALGVAGVAFLLSLLTCAFIAVRRVRKLDALPAVAGDVLLGLGFLMAPWLSLRAAGVSAGEVFSLWVGPGALTRAVPSVCAAIAGLLFAATAHRSSKLEPAV